MNAKNIVRATVPMSVDNAYMRLLQKIFVYFVGT